MKNNLIKQETKASITVLLSLILFLILSLLFTIIEGARVSTAKIYAKRALTTSMDSILAEFYGPLWKEYHIFGLDTGYGSTDPREAVMMSKLEEYMSYTLSPNQDMSTGIEGIDLYQTSMKALSLLDNTMLMDYQGELMLHEAVEYMKYSEVADVIESLFEKMSILETPQKVSIIYEEKQKVEEELAEIDEGVLELMQLLDGIATGKRGIEVSKDGSLVIKPYFVKKICTKDITQSNVGINNESVFQVLTNHYINPLYQLNKIEEIFAQIEEIDRINADIQYSDNEVLTSIQMAEENLDKLNKAPNKTTEMIQQIEEVKEQIAKLKDQNNNYQKEMKEYQSKKQQYTIQIIANKNEITILAKNILPIIEDALISIDKILVKTQKTDELVKEFEAVLEREKEGLYGETYLILQDELDGLKRYTSEASIGYGFAPMKGILEHNKEILAKTNGDLDMGIQRLNGSDYTGARDCFKNVYQQLETYQIEGLTLDYSTIVFGKEKFTALNQFGTLLENGITSLIIDPSEISNRVITETLLPSVLHNQREGEQENVFDFTSLFKNGMFGSKSTDTSKLFTSFQDGTKSQTMMSSAVNELAEHFLFQEYLKEHFYSYPAGGETTDHRKPSALLYEREYLLIGDTSDQANLASVITHIVLIRTILDFVTILGDKTRCAEAEGVAAALVGFTGLPILVSITKTLILLLWSFAEALVDTCALLKGTEVPIMKKELNLSFLEIFQLNRAFIQEKASRLTAEKDLSFSYQDYLYLFLFLKNKNQLSYYTMDLIQENLRIRYEDNFRMANCMFGFQVSADFNIPTKFTNFAFVNRYLYHHPKRFEIHTEAAYSY